MTKAEQLEEVKKSLNISGTYLDSTLSGYIDEVKLYMIDGGVNFMVVNTPEAIGCICRGVSDLYIDKQLSQYFYQRLSQLATAIVIQPEPSGGNTVTSVVFNVNGDGIVKRGYVELSDGSRVDIDIEKIPALEVTGTNVTIDDQYTTLTVVPPLEQGNHYLVTHSGVTMPAYGDDLTDTRQWTHWDGVSKLDASSETIRVVECNADNIALKGGTVTINMSW